MTDRKELLTLAERYMHTGSCIRIAFDGDGGIVGVTIEGVFLAPAEAAEYLRRVLARPVAV